MNADLEIINSTATPPAGQPRVQPAPAQPAQTGQLPVDFRAEMCVLAVEPTTGAEVELGYEQDGEWHPVRFGEGPSLLSERGQLESWLTDPETLEAYDGPLDVEYSRQCVAETVQRCLAQAREIIEGVRPVPAHPVEVWPINNQVWRVERGERIPPGITHIRPVGPYQWHDTTELLL